MSSNDIISLINIKVYQKMSNDIVIQANDTSLLKSLVECGY